MKNVFKHIEANLKRTIRHTIPTGVGTLAVNHFKDSFKLQKFNEPGERPWKEVKRRKNESGWYGFKHRAKKRRPGVRARKKDGKGNFSPAAVTRAILFGSGSSKLRDGLFVKKSTAKLIIVANRNIHATIHNRGGKFLVFGKRSAVMPKRQYMGPGPRLRGKIKKFIKIELQKALSK